VECKEGEALRRTCLNKQVWVALLLTLAVVAGGAWMYAHWALGAAGGGSAIRLVIPQGASALQIGELLRERGLVRDAWIFRLLVAWRGLDGALQAGEYLFSPDEGIHRILHRLAAGDVVLHRVTIPEGYTVAQIADALARKGLVDRDRFLRLSREDRRFWIPQMRGNASGSLEGYLFPDTYLLPSGLPEERVVQLMVDRFRAAAGSLLEGPLPMGLTPHEVVTVASLVEREAQLDPERARIAGVIYNRLRRGMLLQVDATVLYALGRHQEVVLYRDLEVDSPYNTYRYAGLPPGPIASPGLPSILAALRPESHDYLYYVARPDGSHVFSRTLEEHNRAIRTIRGGR
jgi:UPF0755 protein